MPLNKNDIDDDQNSLQSVNLDNQASIKKKQKQSLRASTSIFSEARHISRKSLLNQLQSKNKEST